MGDVLLVHVADRKEQLLDGLGCVTLAQSFDLDNVIVKLASCHELCHNVKVGIVLQKLKDAHHVRMICLLKHLKLLLHQID